MMLATAAALALLATPLAAQPNDAEPATRAANEAITKTLPLADRADKPQREKGGCGHGLCTPAPQQSRCIPGRHTGC
ncbi:hypothetical protein [Rhodopseudomonas sp. BR0M22]|uniref:hypothetical protein n=1 Tax=Rhodopseudomonas sp. BR0M22 TaxID=2269369 RepID=UPI0013E0C0B4|nr:hypothetical protein [Rhodopseudomonas sp. BR0M22]